jgi:thioredoxin reductase
MTLDCAIIGGGIAGLSAGLVLGRSCRRVVICDAGHPRNAAAKAVHCFPGQEGVAPAALLRICRQELACYPDVSILTAATVTDSDATPTGFALSLEGMPSVHSRAVILATGVVDKLPDIPGIENYFGASVHVCPYCDGWENRGQPLIVAGADRGAVELATELRIWSGNVMLCTNSEARISPDMERMLEEAGVAAARGRITALEGAPPRLEAVRLADGSRHEAAAIFFKPEQQPRSPLAVKLGCRLASGGECLHTSEDNKTSVAGVFAAGNIRGGLELAMVAAADGIKAGVAVNEYLLKLDAGRMQKPARARRVQREPQPGHTSCFPPA